jgi:hypothetical protein
MSAAGDKCKARRHSVILCVEKHELGTLTVMLCIVMTVMNECNYPPLRTIVTLPLQGDASERTCGRDTAPREALTCLTAGERARDMAR